MSKTKFKQTEIGMIPEDWEVKKIGEIADVRSSKRVYMKDYVKNGVPFYRSKEIIQKSNGQDVSTELFISNDLYDNFKIKFGAPEEDDILITSVGTLGVSYRVKKEEKFYFKDGNLTWLRNYKNNIVPLYFEYFIKSNIFLEQLLASSIGSTQQAITIIALKNIKISLPKYEEQSAIAKILSDLDSKIEILQKQNETLEKIGQTIFKHWFVDFEFPNEEGNPYKSSGGEMVESELGEIPGGWSVGKLDSIFKFVKGKKPNQTYVIKIKNFVPQILIENLDGKEPLYTDSKNLTIISILDLVMVMDGASSGRIEIGFRGALGSTLAKLEINNKNLTGIIYYYLKSLEEDIKQNTTGTSIPHTDKNKVYNYNLALPSDDILINEFKNSSLPNIKKIINNKYEIKTLQKTRDLLLPKLMTGKIRVPLEVEE